MEKAKILIVEDQFIEADNLKGILKGAGYSVLPMAASVQEALSIIERETPDLVLLDIYLDGPKTGIDLAIFLRQQGLAFIYLSANSDRMVLEQAKATCPYGFLVKPFRTKDVLVTLEIAWYLHRHRPTLLRQENQQPPAEHPFTLPATSGNAYNSIIGGSPVMRQLLRKVNIVAPSDTSALILGENGTGKELIAQSIHQASARKDKPLVTVNCAILPVNLIESELFGHEKGAFTGASERRIGKFEQADGGTIFLDEIGELPSDVQAKFLRVLQEKEIEPLGGRKKKIDVRVIAATNRGLEEEMAGGNFRMDLYYRLSVFPLYIPPLRERKEDIPELAGHFLKIYAAKENKQLAGFTEPVIRSLLDYDWPGNVRELENAIVRGVLMADGPHIDTLDLRPWSKKDTTSATTTTDSPKSLSEQEKEYILAALTSCNWKLYGQGGAAELLKMNPSTLHSRMKKLGINKKLLSSANWLKR